MLRDLETLQDFTRCPQNPEWFSLISDIRVKKRTKQLTTWDGKDRKQGL